MRIINKVFITLAIFFTLVISSGCEIQTESNENKYDNIDISFEYNINGKNYSCLFDEDYYLKKNCCVNDKIGKLPKILDGMEDYFCGWKNKNTKDIIDEDFVCKESMVLVPSFTSNNIYSSIVSSGSMSPTLNAGDGFIYMECDDYNVDDIVVWCRSNNKELRFTHRISSISKTEDNKILYTLSRDYDDVIVDSISFEDIIGKVVYITNDENYSYVENFQENADLSYNDIRSILLNNKLFDNFENIQIKMPDLKSSLIDTNQYELCVERDENAIKKYSYSSQDENTYIWNDGDNEYIVNNDIKVHITNKSNFEFNSTFDELINDQFRFMCRYFLNVLIFDDFYANRVVDEEKVYINCKVEFEEVKFELTMKYDSENLNSILINYYDEFDKKYNLEYNNIDSVDVPTWFKIEDF